MKAYKLLVFLFVLAMIALYSMIVNVSCTLAKAYDNLSENEVITTSQSYYTVTLPIVFKDNDNIILVSSDDDTKNDTIVIPNNDCVDCGHYKSSNDGTHNLNGCGKLKSDGIDNPIYQAKNK